MWFKRTKYVEPELTEYQKFAKAHRQVKTGACMPDPVTKCATCDTYWTCDYVDLVVGLRFEPDEVVLATLKTLKGENNE